MKETALVKKEMKTKSVLRFYLILFKGLSSRKQSTTAVGNYVGKLTHTPYNFSADQYRNTIGR